MTIQAKALVRLTGIILSLSLFTTIAAKAQAGAGDSGSTGSYNINDKSVKIEKGGNYTIKGKGAETEYTITVNLPSPTDVADITINNVKIGLKGCPFNIKQGVVKLTLEGDNVLKAQGTGSDNTETWCAALQVSEDSELVITKESIGKLTATGGYGGAGIGGGDSSPVGYISIAGGTVAAKGGNGGAGIGGGSNSSAGSITIAGGTVEATGGVRGAGIGGGGNSSRDVSITISGGTVDAKGGSMGSGIGGGSYNTGGSITISGGKVTTKGNIGAGEGSQSPAKGTISGGTIVCKSFTSDLTISGGSVRTDDNSVDKNGKVMTVVKGSPNELPANTKVTSIKIGEVTYNWKDVYTDENGMLYLYLQQDQPGSATVTIGGNEYTANALREYDITNGPITITAAGDYAIVGGETPTENAITVELGKKEDVANITIDGVDILKSNPKECPFNIKQGTVHLTLAGKDNILQAGEQCAALQVSANSELLITKKSTGMLTARGGRNGAGIGGGDNSKGGSITIAGGTVEAIGGGSGAGIGGGYSSFDVSITIVGGTVMATGRDGGAGIGGGNSSNGGSITIEGGTVTATGGDGGAGIGGGNGGFDVSITISGGKVTTEGNIGNGEIGSGATGKISGGTIVCKSISPTFTITGGSVRTEDISVIDGKVMAVVKGSPNELPANTKVTSITIGGVTYNWTDVYTDENGMLYLYLNQDQLGSATVTIGGNEYTANALREYDITNGPITITAAGDYAIVGGETRTGNTITVELGSKEDVANITIEGVNIVLKGCPFDIKQGVVNLTLDGDNVLKALGTAVSGNKETWCAALQVSEDSKLVITKESTGKLTATGGDYGAGIGGGFDCSAAGYITIEGGTVEATGGSGAAGIGGGIYSKAGSITIEGGTVVATGGYKGAGIGGGFGSRSGFIFIKGGKVTTEGNIGNGEDGSGATGEIKGGTIVCKSISPDLSITGGSVHTEDNSVDKEGKGMAVVKGLPKETKVTSITIDNASYNSTDVYTDDKGQLYLYIPKGGAVPVSITIDDKVYTLHVTLEPIITISGKEVTYNESDHKDKSILIGNNVTFTIDAPDASVIDLTIEPGGKLLTEKQLEVKGGFTVDLKANAQKWITFCSPVPLKLLYPNWATWAGDTNCLFLKSGFTTANDQKWTFEQSIKEDTPYLIGVPTGVAAYTLYAQNVKLPGRKEDISINPPSGFDNNLLFCANTSLTEQTLKDIYVLDIDRQKLVLKTEDYILKPFEAYFVASPATRNMLKTISLLGSDGQPTGIAEVKVQKNTNFKAYSNSPGTLTFENQGEPAAVIVVNALGKGMFVYSNFTGSKHLYGLSAGVYFVRSNKEVKKVIVK